MTDELLNNWSPSPFGEITEEKLTPLRYACNFLTRGITPNYPDHDEGYWVLNQSCVRRKGVDFSERKYHVPEDEIDKEYLLRDGDVLLNSTGTGTAGRSTIFRQPEDVDKVFADSHITILRPDPKILTPEYLCYVLQSQVMVEYFDEVLSVGATNQIELNKGDIASLKVPTPPIEQQKKIVEDLDKVNEQIGDLISRSEDLISLLEERRESEVTRRIIGSVRGGNNE